MAKFQIEYTKRVVDFSICEEVVESEDRNGAWQKAFAAFKDECAMADKDWWCHGYEATQYDVESVEEVKE